MLARSICSVLSATYLCRIERLVLVAPSFDAEDTAKGSVGDLVFSLVLKQGGDGGLFSKR